MKSFTKGIVRFLTVLVLLCMMVAGLQATDTVAINENYFPDANFRAYVMQFDTDGDGALSAAECGAVKRISVVGKRIADLRGVEYFVNLEQLYCSQNLLRHIDVSANTKLKVLNVNMNVYLDLLDVSKNTELYWLGCVKTGISELDISNNTALTYLACGDNRLTELDLSQNVLLEELSIESNPIAQIDLSCNPNLSRFTFADTLLTSLDLSKQKNKVVMQYGDLYYPYDFVSNPISLSTLTTGGFDVRRTMNWVNSHRIGNQVYIMPGMTEISYDYDCGNGQTVTFMLASSVAASDYIPVFWGDLTGDDAVNAADLAYLSNHIGRPGRYKIPIGILADYVQDSSVDVVDLQYFSNHIGRPERYPIPPEPSESN